MKILFLHLSDMHFEKQGDVNETFIKRNLMLSFSAAG